MLVFIYTCHGSCAAPEHTLCQICHQWVWRRASQIPSDISNVHDSCSQYTYISHMNKCVCCFVLLTRNWGISTVPGCFFFWFGIYTASMPSTTETHMGGGAVPGKTGGSPARRHFRNIVLKQTFAYADTQTNEEENTTHNRNIGFILGFCISLLMLTMWLTVINFFFHIFTHILYNIFRVNMGKR